MPYHHFCQEKNKLFLDKKVTICHFLFKIIKKISRRYSLAQKKDEPGKKFSQDVKAAMEKAGVTQVQLAAMTGIRQDHLSRLLSGERGWKPLHIERVCRALKIEPLKYLADEIRGVPLRGKIREGVFHYGPIAEPKKSPHTIAPRIIGRIRDDSLSFGNVDTSGSGAIKLSELPEQTYGLEITDDSLAPLIKKGSLVYVQPSPQNLSDDDLILYIDPDGVGKMYRLGEKEADFVKLRSLSSLMPDIKIHLTHLKVLHRVVMIVFP
jgi:transcriptional regulator with XRE-family HTH domain